MTRLRKLAEAYLYCVMAAIVLAFVLGLALVCLVGVGLLAVMLIEVLLAHPVAGAAVFAFVAFVGVMACIVIMATGRS